MFPLQTSSPHNSGVSKVVTVDVKGSAPLWMKIKDLADGVTYNFRIRAKPLPMDQRSKPTSPLALEKVLVALHLAPYYYFVINLKLKCLFSALLEPYFHICDTGAPGPPGEPFISRYGSALTLHWSSGDPGRAPITRYVIEARPSGKWKRKQQKLFRNAAFNVVTKWIMAF